LEIFKLGDKISQFWRADSLSFFNLKKGQNNNRADQPGRKENTVDDIVPLLPRSSEALLPLPFGFAAISNSTLAHSFCRL
jgi:hypothetical protein